MSISKKIIYIIDIAKEKCIKDPNDILACLMPFDIIFASALNADRLVKIPESDQCINIPRTNPIKIREEYLQEILRKGSWTGTKMLSSIVLIDDNPYIPKETVCPMNVIADDVLSISIVDLFVYEHDLVDIEDQNPDIFVRLIKPEETSELHSALPDQPQPIKKLSDLAEIIRQIENALPAITLRPKERQYVTALLARLGGSTFKDCYIAANPRTQSEETKTWLDQGKRYCEKAHIIVKEKMKIDFDFSLIKGYMDY